MSWRVFNKKVGRKGLECHVEAYKPACFLKHTAVSNKDAMGFEN